MNILNSIKIFSQGLLGKPDDLGIPNNEADMASLGDILNAVYAIAAVIAVVVLIIAGINYVTSSGDASKVTKAKNMIIYTVVGLIVILLAFGVTNLVLRGLS